MERREHRLPGTAALGPGLPGAFEYLSHVGELALRLQGQSIAEVLRQASMAITEVLLQGSPLPAAESVREIRLSAPDRGALLIDWLNELLFLAERKRWLPGWIERIDATDTRVHAIVHGAVLLQAPSLVKAATWHGLRFDEVEGGFVAVVLLDV